MGILGLQSATMALSLFLLSTCSTAKATEATLAHDRPGESREQATDGAVFLSANSSIRDILNHQAFAGFSRRMLPWDGRSHDENMPLAEIGSLLPYHSLVNPETVVGSLNSMTDEVGKGRTVFYDIYTEAQKRADPTKEHTGLIILSRNAGSTLCGHRARRRVFLCWFHPRRLSVCRRNQQQGIQCLRPEISGGTRRNGRHPGSGCGHLVHLREC